MQEQRYSTNVRAAGDKQFQIVGYAHKYGAVAELVDFDETIQTGAFEDSVRSMADVKCLLNHDPSVVLGRTLSGTLKLEADSIGLRFLCQLNAESEQHRNVYSAIERGDLNECSFAFTVPKGAQTFEAQPGKDKSLRKISKLNLLDVSIVTWPAYKDGTSANARSFFDFEARSALGALLGKPLVAPQNLVDLNEVRKMVDSWHRQEAARLSRVIGADVLARRLEVYQDLTNLDKAIESAELLGEDTRSLKELFWEIHNANNGK